jgi:rubrerythrin
VIGILVLWLFFDRKKDFKGVYPEEKFVWQCKICTYFYVDSQNDEFSVCPRCGSYNSRKEHRYTQIKK